MSRPLGCAAAILALTGHAACGGSGDGDGSEPETIVSCSADPRLDAYAGGLDKAGELGALSFRFSELDPDPPAKGNNTFHVQLRDTSGTAVMAPLGVELNMPDHGHGTSIEPVVSPEAGLDRYRVAPLYLFMPGVWRITFEAYSSDAADAPLLDRVVLHFCIEG